MTPPLVIAAARVSLSLMVPSLPGAVGGGAWGCTGVVVPTLYSVTRARPLDPSCRPLYSVHSLGPCESGGPAVNSVLGVQDRPPPWTPAWVAWRQACDSIRGRWRGPCSRSGLVAEVGALVPSVPRGARQRARNPLGCSAPPPGVQGTHSLLGLGRFRGGLQCS